eukprot:79988-Pelagomonas_calceolata.AAC.3
MAAGGARVLSSQAKLGSIIVPYNYHQTPTICRIEILNNISEGMGSIGGQAATECARNGRNFTPAPGDVPART